MDIVSMMDKARLHARLAKKWSKAARLLVEANRARSEAEDIENEASKDAPKVRKVAVAY